MRPGFSLKRGFRSVLAGVLLCFQSGCQAPKTETILLGEWVQEICASTGIAQFEQKTPYYLNIGVDAPCYPAVQALVEWGVLEPDAGFQPDAVLTREWAAYTLINLAGETADSRTSVLKDSVQSQFPDHVERAAAFGLMGADARGKFYPKQNMDAAEARKALARISEYINNRNLETTKAEVEWDRDAEILQQQPLEFEPQSGRAVFPAGSGIRPDLYVRWREDDTEHLYRVESAELQPDRILAELKAAEAGELLDRVDVQNSFEVDFSKAEITDESGGPETSGMPVSCRLQNRPVLMSGRPLERSHTVGGWTVSYKVTSSGIRAEVYQGSSEGGKTYASFTLNKVHPSFRWKMRSGVIEDGYFKVSYQTTESAGIYKGSYRTLYGDLSRLRSTEFMPALKELFRTRQEAAEITVPICTVRVPVPNAPLFQITMRLQLRLYATGRAELSLSGQHVSGMEIRNNRLRPINECIRNAEAVIRADTSIVGNTQFGFNLNQLLLADIGAEAGARARVKTTVHLFDERGRLTSAASSIPADLADEMAAGNENVRVCADMKAYWVMNLIFNSPQSLAGKLNLSRRMEILNESNAPLIPGLNRHFENWQAVDRCTVTGRRYGDAADHLPDTSRLRPDAYTMILSAGESARIRFTAMPSGYSEKDLLYSSQNPAVASAGADGTVTAKAEGSSIMTVSTKDGKYQTKISILVRRSRRA